jgi:hypothetical protein
MTEYLKKTFIFIFLVFVFMLNKIGAWESQEQIWCAA